MRLMTLFLLAVPATVSACEGDCIVGITNAWLGNYTSPIHTVSYSLVGTVHYHLGVGGDAVIIDFTPRLRKWQTSLRVIQA